MQLSARSVAAPNAELQRSGNVATSAERTLGGRKTVDGTGARNFVTFFSSCRILLLNWASLVDERDSVMGSATSRLASDFCLFVGDILSVSNFPGRDYRVRREGRWLRYSHATLTI